ncbi:hypothetical protein BLL38_02305 [Pseudomonas gessardii]|nr:hypothetical protein BLL38_02305 [Pseudomonas gessardii]
MKEAVGAAYSIDAMRYAQAMTWRAIEQLSQQIRPGMLESQARELGKQVLADLDMQRIWHPLLAGKGTDLFSVKRPPLTEFRQSGERGGGISADEPPRSVPHGHFSNTKNHKPPAFSRKTGGLCL